MSIPHHPQTPSQIASCPTAVKLSSMVHSLDTEIQHHGHLRPQLLPHMRTAASAGIRDMNWVGLNQLRGRFGTEVSCRKDSGGWRGRKRRLKLSNWEELGSEWVGVGVDPVGSRAKK